MESTGHSSSCCTWQWKGDNTGINTGYLDFEQRTLWEDGMASDSKTQSDSKRRRRGGSGKCCPYVRLPEVEVR